MFKSSFVVGFIFLLFFFSVSVLVSHVKISFSVHNMQTLFHGLSFFLVIYFLRLCKVKKKRIKVVLEIPSSIFVESVILICFV